MIALNLLNVKGIHSYAVMPQSPGVIRPKLGCYVIPACIKRESSLQNQWIPAFAGMTKTETYLNQPLITEGLPSGSVFGCDFRRILI